MATPPRPRVKRLGAHLVTRYAADAARHLKGARSHVRPVTILFYFILFKLLASPALTRATFKAFKDLAVSDVIRGNAAAAALEAQ